MFQNLKQDFRRVYNKTSYKGGLRKALAAVGSQGFQAVASYRICRWLVKRHIPIIHLLIQRLVEIGTGISIPPEANIGKGLLIQHFGGIVINDGTNIGNYCTLSHCVTIGNKRPGGKSPVIGNNVYICVGAKILGDITIGDNCIIGANAVVMQSVPEKSIVGGIPGKVIKRIDNIDAYKEFYYED